MITQFLTPSDSDLQTSTTENRAEQQTNRTLCPYHAAGVSLVTSWVMVIGWCL